MINWKLIFLLSLFGIAMAFASVFGLNGKSEPILWPAIFVVYGILIVRNTNGKYFPTLSSQAFSMVSGSGSFMPVYIPPMLPTIRK